MNELFDNIIRYFKMKKIKIKFTIKKGETFSSEPRNSIDEFFEALFLV